MSILKTQEDTVSQSSSRSILLAVTKLPPRGFRAKSCRSSVLCFYIHCISFYFFEIQGLTSYDVSCSRIQREHVLSFVSHTQEGVSDLRVEPLILVSGLHPQDGGTWRHFFPKANPVHVLAEHWGIVIGIDHQDSDLSSTALGRVPTV
uniref:Uncharacterized protein n=1 Tax=Prolemur simus TaxID=1328070 RepID=A0A8C9A9Q8_PROSS